MNKKEKDKLLAYVRYVLEDKIERLTAKIVLLQIADFILGGFILIGIGMSIAGSFEGGLLAIFSFLMLCVSYDLERMWRRKREFFMQFVEEVDEDGR